MPASYRFTKKVVRYLLLIHETGFIVA